MRSVLKTIKIVTSTETKTLKKTEETKHEKVPFTQVVKSGEFYVIPFEATLLSTFPSLLKYLEFSENMSRFVSIKSIDIKTNPDDTLETILSGVIYIKPE